MHYCNALSVVSGYGTSSIVVLFHIFDFSLESAYNFTKMYKREELNFLYQVCVCVFSRADQKTTMTTLASDIFDFSSGTNERNLMKLDRMQVLNVL